MPAATHHRSAATLNDFVALNEGIKQVVGIAFQINIMALNAILLSHRAGSVAVGFGVISRELRIMSVELTRLMDGLSDDAQRTVRQIAELLRREHRHRLLRLAWDSSHNTPLEILLETQHSELGMQRRQIQAARQTLNARLEDARQLCQFGIALSRSAKIEAAYGRNFSRALGEVSDSFDQQIHAILPAIDRLCRHMQESR